MPWADIYRTYRTYKTYKAYTPPKAYFLNSYLLILNSPRS